LRPIWSCGSRKGGNKPKPGTHVVDGQVAAHVLERIGEFDFGLFIATKEERADTALEVGHRQVGVEFAGLVEVLDGLFVLADGGFDQPNVEENPRGFRNQVKLLESSIVVLAVVSFQGGGPLWQA
jgi:hypothetical protein